MRNAKTRLLAAGVAGVTALTLAGCGQSKDDSASSDSGTTLKMLVPSYDDNVKELWGEVIDGFKKENPNIDIDLQVESWENINDVVRQNIQADKAPDILNIDSFTDFAADDLLYSAKDVASKKTLDNIQDSFKEHASMEGTQYGLPLFASARALFYNEDLFKEAGITAPPKTWAELEKDAKAIKALGKDGVDGYGMPLGNEEAQAEAAIWFFGAGGGYGDENKITVDQKANVEAANFMQKLIKEGATEANPGSAQRTPLGKTFFQGKLGMVVGLPQYKKLIEEQNPKLNYKIAPIPTKDGSEVTLGVADHLMAFDNGADKQEAIKKFFDYFYSDAAYPKFVGTLGFIPITKSAGEAMKDDPTTKEFIPLLPKAKFYPFTNPKWQSVQGSIQSNIGKIATEDPATVLKQIQSESEQD
ncbi:extracellular solute-binding protein [Winkia neuii]|uniref:extracellular solute-binding protein n=1 Tax=Winkia TaxID=2692118 RepID=UPI0014322C8D|nr:MULTISPECIES: extracellular solute-binding protein [Winkia]MDK7185854.1 extracellular solute-binding protein [Winkia sp. UMB1295B]NJJ16298.1 extracellular solute-binding protein [Winkia neuii]